MGGEKASKISPGDRTKKRSFSEATYHLEAASGLHFPLAFGSHLKSFHLRRRENNAEDERYMAEISRFQHPRSRNVKCIDDSLCLPSFINLRLSREERKQNHRFCPSDCH
eukprot:scaffold8732_cov87-Cylindrotheca_fusiformis.AAC.2